jgi:hypothetical protein
VKGGEGGLKGGAGQRGGEGGDVSMMMQGRLIRGERGRGGTGWRFAVCLMSVCQQQPTRKGA